MKSSSTLENLVSRSQTETPSRGRPPAWILPVVILVGFSLLFLILFRDRLLPAPEVRVARILATPGEAGLAGSGADAPTAESPRFQASGWLEAAPFPIRATALIDGVVEKVHVAPGDSVRKGQTLATLVADDARLAHDAARHKLRTYEAAMKAHEAAIAAAEQRVTGIRAELAAAIARRDEAEDLSHRLGQLPEGSVSRTDVIAARLRHQREVAQADAASAAVEQTRAELVRLQAEAAVKKGEFDTASVAVEQAALALDRTEIKSPTDGRVLRLLAAPGQRKTMMVDDPEGATIAILYRPEEMQARVDVPLADAGGLQVGQRARIHCALLPDAVFTGEITQIAGEADLQRNTLQAKVRVAQPADRLRPDMLCRVEFLDGPGHPGSRAAPSAALALWVPEEAMAEGAVWICDPDSGRVRKQAVESTRETRDGYVRLSSGARPGEWVVVSPGDLRDGQRVNPILPPP